MIGRYLPRFTGDQRDLADALGRDLTHRGFDGLFAFMLLATRHGDNAL